MNAKLVHVALIAVSTSWLGCAVQAGLANAPTLGTTPGDDRRVHDAIANGRDSCERQESTSPLRGHTPPCAGESVSAAVTHLRLPPAQGESAPNPEYVPWPACAMVVRPELSFTTRGSSYDDWWRACNDPFQ